MTRLTRHLHLAWLATAVGIVAPCVGVGTQTAIARGFMGTVLGIAVIAATAGQPTARAVAAASFLAGSLVLAFGSGSFADPPSTLWGEVLDSDATRLRHEITLPRADRRWRAGTAAGASPFLYVCARGRLEAPDTLDVSLDGDPLAALEPSMMFGPRPQPESVGFYRVPVARARLDGRDTTRVDVARHPGAARPLEVCGTFMGKPTLAMDASQSFDGSAWSSPWTTRRGRYQVELRLVSVNGHVFGAWY